MVKFKIKQIVFQTLVLKIFPYIGLKFVRVIIMVYHYKVYLIGVLGIK
jgi:hypothetical protein